MRYEFPGKNVAFVLVLLQLMIMPDVLIVENYRTMSRLGILDSIPAIFAVTTEPFLVFTSNAFAILGLRALYFLLAGLQDKLVYLNKGLGVILVYVGLKMLASFWDIHLNIGLSLGFIVFVLAVTVVLSLRASSRAEAEAASAAGAAVMRRAARMST